MPPTCKKPIVRRSAWLAAVAGLFAIGPAHAYIDPNIGGWLFQILFPLLMAVAGAWAVLRHKIRQFLWALVEKLRNRAG